MMRPWPKEPSDLGPEFLTEIVSTLRPGLRIESARILDAKTFGDWDDKAPVSTSARVILQVAYGGTVTEQLPERILVKMSFADERIWCGRLDALFQTEVDFYNKIRP